MVAAGVPPAARHRRTVRTENKGTSIMSLNWDTTKCDEQALDTDEAKEVTKAIVFVTMAVDMGTITEANVGEFVERVRAYEKLRGTMMTTWDGEEMTDRPLTEEDIRLRIGLRTNVTTTSKRSFNAKLARLAREA
jgi:hypothetical protein